jgi:radical SAM superfamily enzyme YgiQ (UPF0313 family)
MEKIAFITLYDMICYGTRLLCTQVEKHGLESHLILLKKETSYVPLFKQQDQYQTYQYYYNGLLRGSHYAVDKITDRDVHLLLKTLDEISPSLIGLSTRSFAYDLCKHLFPVIKKRFPEVPIVGGGWGPSLEPEKFLEFCDFVCFGEGEKPIQGICEILKNGGNFEEVPNLIYRRNGDLRRNRVEPAISVEKLNLLPFPDFSTEKKYLISDETVRHGKDFYNNRVYDCFAARGCPFSCTYCLSGKYHRIYKKESGKACPKYRLRSIDVVFDEVKRAKDRGAEFIRFKDEVFPIHPKWIEEFLDRYNNEIGLPFFGFVRPEFHSAETICMLKEAGLCVTMLGIQSGADEIRRKVYKRKLSKDRVVEFAKTLDDLSLQYSYHFIYRNPFEHESHLEESLLFTYQLPYSTSFIFKLEPLPGTPIKEMIEAQQPTPISVRVANWYAVLHCMSLKNSFLRKLAKIVHKHRIFKRMPIVLSIVFIPSLIGEFYNVLKNRHVLKASLHFSHKTK